MSNFNFVTDARLANGSYTSNNTAITATIDGWKPVVVELKAGEKFSDTFGAQLYEKDGQYKVVYRGTEGNLEDWKQNGNYGQNAWSEEWGDTVAFMAKAFKLWLDINSDARTGVGELYGLADAGVKSINVSTGAVSFTDGQTLTLQRTQLSANQRSWKFAA